MSIRDGKLIYHLVPLDSLESIIEHGLMSRDELAKNGIGFIDTADQQILNKRERLALSQYIPFHFHIHTAYDTAVKNDNCDKTFIYICLHRDYAKRMNFKILPIHPTSDEQPQLFDYEEGFKAIDWETMELTKNDAEERDGDSRYHQQVRMAECLSPITIQVNSFHEISVPDKETEKYVRELCIRHKVNPRFITIRNWFV